MKYNEMSLPLGYNELAEYYDVLTESDDDSKNQVIGDILKKHNVKTVLDLTCGTGAQVFWLIKHGYKVVGMDFSPALLQIARNKAKKEKIDVTLLKGDMRTDKVGDFDATITIFNAVGHLIKADFEKAMRNINRNLKDGGLYVFDIFNLEAMTDDVVKNLAMDLKKTSGSTKIHNIQYSELDKDNGLLTSYDKFSIQKDLHETKTYQGKFTLQIYTARELREMLAKSGFETIGQYGIDGSKFAEKETENILTVARKIKQVIE